MSDSPGPWHNMSFEEQHAHLRVQLESAISLFDSARRSKLRVVREAQSMIDRKQKELIQSRWRLRRHTEYTPFFGDLACGPPEGEQ